jgi:hypothetical protein
MKRADRRDFIVFPVGVRRCIILTACGSSIDVVDLQAKSGFELYVCSRRFLSSIFHL